MSDTEQASSVEAPTLDEDSLWDKIRRVAKKAGREVIKAVLTLYYCLIDSDTPMWAKSVIIGALLYFISPVDAVPDVLPGVGFSDDLAVLIGASMVIAAHIKSEHRERASQWCDNVFGPEDEPQDEPNDE